MAVLLSIIIPLAPNEMAWRDLLPDLNVLSNNCEIILATSHNAPTIEVPISIRQVQEGSNRAAQMNAAAKQATGAYLWFLHADSRLHRTTIPALLKVIVTAPQALFYADLVFLSPALPLMTLNAWGANFRSRILGMPFGDQGLCIHKNSFHELGGYPENTAYGEDHLFVWYARQQGIKLCPINAPLYTSARKYQINGWLATTLNHLTLTFKQAFPEWKKLCASRSKS